MYTLHIVSFNNPYPPDYGGVIDILFKIRALKEAGVNIILHIFNYGRVDSPELNKYCKEVYYYPRKTGWFSQLSFVPYISRSRRSRKLLSNLAKDKNPILFEGLHSCYYLSHPLLKNREKLVRMHNIEHEYYYHLAKSSRNVSRRIYYYFESWKLKRYEKILTKADSILAISASDNDYFKRKYCKSIFVGAFHPNTAISSHQGKGSFILMHGNLSVEENETAVLHCIRKIFRYISFPVVIAGKNPSEAVRKEVSQHQNISLSANPNIEEMLRLQHEAHIHICYTFQSSGVKLKLLNALYNGRFVVANPLMTQGSGLDDAVEIGKTDDELIQIINRLLSNTFQPENTSIRKALLRNYDNKENAVKIVNLLGIAEAMSFT